MNNNGQLKIFSCNGLVTVFFFKQDIYPDVAVERAILDLMVQCPNESNGCKWTGELRIVKVTPFC